eukprot:GHRR01032615.1.p2 GENE.GHRR01032615.1~~GHRR01032615.1.p2  ORF type:complete len:100 (+),score=19.45 GHRR01032615.1:758-1057(+)
MELVHNVCLLAAVRHWALLQNEMLEVATVKVFKSRPLCCKVSCGLGGHVADLSGWLVCAYTLAVTGGTCSWCIHSPASCSAAGCHTFRGVKAAYCGTSL